MATDKKSMGQFAIGFRLKVAGVICTGVMAQVVIAMFAAAIRGLERGVTQVPDISEEDDEENGIREEKEIG